MELSSLFEEKGHKEVNCYKHGNYTSMLISFRNNTHWVSCPICIKENSKAQIIQQQIQTSNEVKEQEVTKLLGRACIPKYFQNATFSNYEVKNSAQLQVVENCKTFASNFQDAMANGIHGLFIGKTGTGKSHLSCAIIKQVLDEGYTGLFTTMDEILGAIKKSYNNEGESEYEIMDRLYKIDLLVIDECGISDKKFGLNTLFNLVNKRIFDLKPTILITNELIHLEQKLGSRIISRMEESGFIQNFDWEDYRANRT